MGGGDANRDTRAEQSPILLVDKFNGIDNSSALPSTVESKDTATGVPTSEATPQNATTPTDNSASQPSSECPTLDTEMSQASSVDHSKAMNSAAPSELIKVANSTPGYIDFTEPAPNGNAIVNNNADMPDMNVDPRLHSMDKQIPFRIAELNADPQNSFPNPQPSDELPADYFQLPSSPFNTSSPNGISKEMKDLLLARQYKYLDASSGELENDILPFMQGKEKEIPHHSPEEIASDLDAALLPAQLNDDDEEPLFLPSSDHGYDSDTVSELEGFEHNMEDLGAVSGTKRKQSNDTGIAPQSEIKKSRAAARPANRGGKAAKPSGRLARLTAGMKKERAAGNLFNPARLARSNAFHDHGAHKIQGERPTFKSKRKDDALKELAASIPLDQRPMAKYDIAQIKEATRSFIGRGAGTCKSDENGGWITKGMKSSLSHYQLLGTAFMRNRENGTEEPLGGIQGDAMGLGKTVMALANIVDGILLDPNQTTLIVVPASLIRQWMREIETHAESKFVGEALAYYSGSRIHSSNLARTFSQHRIIVTTYDEMRRSYPKPQDPPPECSTPEEKASWLENYYEKNMGIFHKFKFDRLILDEGQAIKNPDSATSIAARRIHATHRWIMSGTPLQDSLRELYAYFRFLRVPTISCEAEFEKDYLKSSKGRTRLHLLLRKYMVRRGYEDTLLGTPLLDIPKSTSLDCPCYLSPTERKIYEVVYRRVVERINGILQAENKTNSYRHIFTLYLLLRQIVDHPLLVHDALYTILEKEDFDKLDQIVREDAPGDQDPLVKNLRVMFRNAWVTRSSESEGQDTFVDRDLDSYAIDSGGVYGSKSDFSTYFDHLRSKSQNNEDATNDLCAVCCNTPKNICTMPCQHSYCLNCLLEHVSNSSQKGISFPPCVQCPELIRYGKQMVPNPEVRHAASMEMREPTKINQRQKLRNAEFQIERWINENGDMIPSSKTLAIKAQILEWLQEDPNAKIIIFSQFIKMIQILAKMCELEGWTNIQFTGMDSIAKRDETVSAFDDPDGTQIMISSLKAGGVGLNLIMASRCIIVDLWWNKAVEEQAFGRIFRKGQTRETFLTRFIVQGTIETKMIGMQERKEKEIDSVINNGAALNQKMTQADILSLFGQIERDEHGNRRLVPHMDGSNMGII